MGARPGAGGEELAPPERGQPVAGAPRGPGGPVGAAAGATKGHQVFKFDKDGKLLMTLGKPGGATDPDFFYQPNDVLLAPNGDIFVSRSTAPAAASSTSSTRPENF